MTLLKNIIYGLLFIFFSCKKNDNKPCVFIEDIKEINLELNRSYAVNNIFKNSISIKKRKDSIFYITVLDYGKTSNGNDTIYNETVLDFHYEDIEGLLYKIKQIDESKLPEPILSFDGDNYKLNYGDGRNFKHFNFSNIYSSKYKNMDEIRIVIDEISKLSSN